MALPQPTYRASRLAAPDLSIGAELIGRGLSAPIGIADRIEAKAEKDRLLKQQEEERQYQRSREADTDAWNQKVRAQKEAEWAKAAELDRLDKELGTNLSSINPTVSKQIMTKAGVTPEQVEVERQRLTDLKYKDAGTKYADEFARLQELNRVQDTYTPSPSAWDRTKDVFKGSLVDTLSSREQAREAQKRRSNDKKSNLSDQQIHELALIKAGLSDDMRGKEFNVDPKLKARAAEYKTKETPISKEEWLKQAQATVLSSQLPFSQQGVLLDRVNKLADAKYGKTADAKTQLDYAKHALNVKEFEEKKKQGYWKQTPSDKSGFNFAENLYNEAATVGGWGDVEAVDSYIRKNKQLIKSLPKDAQKELLAKLKAKYGREGEWFTWTGWDDLK